jgi:hypothetical protein
VVGLTERLLVDIDAHGRTSVLVWPEGELPGPAGEPFDLVWPLDQDALEDFRWYLEDYLRLPTAVYEDRGGRIADGLAGWGTAIFESLFGGTGGARDAYLKARTRGGPDHRPSRLGGQPRSASAPRRCIWPLERTT